MPPQSDNWSEYRRLVIDHLERHESKLEQIDIKINQHRTDLALLKLRCSMYGALSGGIAAGVAIVAKFYL